MLKYLESASLPASDAAPASISLTYQSASNLHPCSVRSCHLGVSFRCSCRCTCRSPAPQQSKRAHEPAGPMQHPRSEVAATAASHHQQADSAWQAFCRADFMPVPLASDAAERALKKRARLKALQQIMDESKAASMTAEAVQRRAQEVGLAAEQAAAAQEGGQASFGGVASRAAE